MKELTIEEKAKAYNEAIERAKDYKNDTIHRPLKVGENIMDYIFPELAESEDEKIRKELIDFVKSRLAGFPQCEKFISWLEKQGEQSPIDESEQKFKVGDWVVTPSNETKQIKEVTFGNYWFTDGTLYNIIDTDNKGRLWTIQDANDGDILAFYSEYRGNKMVQVGIIEKYVGKHGGCSTTFKIYVGVNWDNNLQIGEYMGCSDIRPATKKQRDALMKAMTDAGYTFDFEKKELKKIKQNSAWSEEDEDRLQSCLNILQAKGIMGVTETINIKWLKSLKERVQPQPTWKPSGEQFGALRYFITSYLPRYNESTSGWIEFENLQSLYNDLKKLKGE